MRKVISASDAVKLIKDNDCIALGGFVGISHPEELSIAVEKRFLKTGSPKNLTIVYAAGQGDGISKGVNHFAHIGLVKRVIGGHWGLAPKMGKLATDNAIEAYNFPQGVISHLYRDIVAKKPGTITNVGLKTFVDPRISGGKLNSKTTENLVEIININGKKWLFFKTFPINIALVRGTTADEDGNISMEKEAGSLEMLSLAQAAKNSGGKVIAQVERLVSNGTLNPWMVKVPGIFIDAIVISKPQNHWQTFGEKYNPSFCGESRIPLDFIPKLPLSERKIISRRALVEIERNSIVNLGIGMPEGISMIANEEEKLDIMKITVEAGAIGGVPAGGLSFGASYNPEAIIDQSYQFDFYDGGGLDIAFLGMAEVDCHGNVNVSKFGDRLAGCGGFINISQNTKKVVFCGTFTSNGLKIEIKNDKLNILNEGKCKKFVLDVEQITFSGQYALENNQIVLFVIERAVFKLEKKGIALIEIAPGIDIKKDILSKDLNLMPKYIFNKGKMY
jgi:propionate CoA-transferase